MLKIRPILCLLDVIRATGVLPKCHFIHINRVLESGARVRRQGKESTPKGSLCEVVKRVVHEPGIKHIRGSINCKTVAWIGA